MSYDTTQKYRINPFFVSRCSTSHLLDCVNGSTTGNRTTQRRATERRATERRILQYLPNVEQLEIDQLNVEYGRTLNVERRTSNPDLGP
jgi:hypothetical protein